MVDLGRRGIIATATAVALGAAAQPRPSATDTINMALVRRHLIEIWQNGRYEIAGELFHPDFVDRNPITGQRPGIAGLIDAARLIRTAFPDSRYEILKLIPAGDLVVDHWILRATHGGPLGKAPATGREVEFRGTDIVRISEGRIIEIWHVEELLTMYQQVGLVPTTLA